MSQISQDPVEAAPEFPNPEPGLSRYRFSLDTQNNDKKTIDLGPVTSIYGTDDQVYMQLIWFDLTREKLVRARTVPVTADSTD